MSPSASATKTRTKMSDAISTASNQLCACCEKVKLCRMYVIQTGDAVWICVECRKGT